MELQPLMRSVELRRAHLYDAYIRRVFTWRPLREESYSPRQALKWLRYLATQMSQRTETQFFIRDLQLDWLPLKVKARIRLFWVGFYGILYGVMGVVLLGFISVVQGINLVDSLSKGGFMVWGFFLGGVLLGSFIHQIFDIPIERRRRFIRMNWRWFGQTIIRGAVWSSVFMFGVGAISAVIEGSELVEFLLLVPRSIFFGVFLSVYLNILLLFNDSFPLYSLRGALALYSFLPFDIEGFLETMKSRILVQGTGTYYQFIHLTFQEHIAALTDEEIEHLATSVDG